MTLQPYSPDELDRFALRLLDLTAALRNMARRSREHDLDEVPIHDKKALEWCERLDGWVQKADADLQVRIIQARARKRAISADDS